MFTLSSPAETRVWQSSDRSNSKGEVSVRDEEKLRFEERDYISETAEVFESNTELTLFSEARTLHTINQGYRIRT
jgi:hypothetical protein